MNTVVILALLALVGFLGAKWLFQKDMVLVERRRSAANLAATLSKYGLVRIPEFLIAYSVTDLAGMATKIKTLADMVATGSDVVLNELEGVFDKVLVEKLKSESGRAFIASKLADSIKVEDTSMIQDAPKPSTK
jgi:hypothetical protein